MSDRSPTDEPAMDPAEEEAYIQAFMGATDKLIARAKATPHPSKAESDAAAQRITDAVRRGMGPTSQLARARRFGPLKRIPVAVAILLAGLGLGYLIFGRTHPPDQTAVLAAMDKKLNQLEQQAQANAKRQEVHLLLQQAQLARSLGQADRVQATGERLQFVVAGMRTAPSAMQEDAWGLFDLGCELFLLREFDLSLWAWGQAEIKGVRTSELFMGMANCHKEMGQWDHAADCLKGMLKQPFSGPDRARGANLLSYVLLRQAEHDARQKETRLAEARNWADEAIRLTGGNYSRANVNLAWILGLQGKNEDARVALEEGRRVAERKLKTYEKSPRLLFSLSIICARLGLPEEAYKKLEDAVLAETRDFPTAFWAKGEPAFTEAKLADTDRFREILRKGPVKQFLPASMAMVWDEELDQPEAPRVSPVVHHAQGDRT